jgi:hypothetical protein
MIGGKTPTGIDTKKTLGSASPCPDPELLAAAASDEEQGVRLHALQCPVCGPIWQSQCEIRAMGLALAHGSVLPAERRRSLAATLLARAESQDDLARESHIETETQEIVRIDPLGDIVVAPPKESRGAMAKAKLHWQRPALVVAVLAAAAAILLVAMSLGNRDSNQVDRTVVAKHSGSDVPANGISDGVAKVAAVGQARYRFSGDGSSRRIIVDDGVVEIDGGGRASVDVVGSNVQIHSTGAHLNASARGGVVESVAVFAGSVEIVVPGRATVSVSAGETWTWVPNDNQTASNENHGSDLPPRVKPDRGAVLPALPPHKPTDAKINKVAIEEISPPVNLAQAKVPPAVATAAEKSDLSPFQEGFTAMRNRQWQTAATAFDKVIDDPSVGQDATYWSAVARSNIGDAELSRARFLRYLAKYPDGSRVGECHVALGRLLLGSDRALARKHFDTAAQDQDPSVRAAALSEIDRLRKASSPE